MVEPIDRNILIITGGFNPSDTSYVTDLQTAITQIGSEDKTIVIDGPIALTASVTVPSNILLKISNKEAYIDHGAFNITVNGPFQCGRWQAFTGAGSVIFGDGATDRILPEWKGAVADGTTDCQTSIQWAVNTSANSNGEAVDFGSGVYYSSGDIYLAYDATNNTGYPSAARQQGRMILIGKGPATTDNANNNEKVRTVINFAANKGIKGTATASSIIKNLYVKNLSIWGNSTGWMIDHQYIGESGYEDVFVYNASATGSGVRWQDTYHVDWRRLYAKAPTGNTGTGVLINNPNMSGGGKFIIDHCASDKFGTTWDFGQSTESGSYQVASGWLLDITAEDPTTYGVLFGHGVSGVEMTLHAENYGNTGCWIKNSASAIVIKASKFVSTASTYDLRIGNNDASTDAGKSAIGITVMGNNFTIVGTGIKLDMGAASSDTMNISIFGNILGAQTGGAGTGIDLDANISDKRGTYIGPNYYGSLASVVSNATAARNLVFFRGGSSANNYTANTDSRTLTANSATPNVSLHSRYKTANTAPTTITNFTGASVGQEIMVRIADSNTTIDFSGTNLKGNAGVDWSPTSGDFMRCIFQDDDNWYCTITDTTA